MKGYALITSMAFLALTTGCAESADRNALFTTSTSIEGHSPEKANYAVYGYGELTVDLYRDGVVRKIAVTEIIAGDRPDFCERVIDSFDQGLIDAIGENVEGIFVHTIFYTTAPPARGEVISATDPEQPAPVFFARFSASGGSKYQAVAINDLALNGNGTFRFDTFVPGDPLSGHLSTTLVRGFAISVGADGQASEDPAGGGIHLQGDFNRVEECPALSEFIRSFDGQ
jgi:hypothetical protein